MVGRIWRPEAILIWCLDDICLEASNRVGLEVLDCSEVKDVED